MGRQVNGVTPERVKAAEAILPHLFAPPLPLSSIESRLAAASPPCHIPPVRSTCLPPPSPPAAITAATTAVEAAFKCFEESGVGSGHVTMAALERGCRTTVDAPLSHRHASLSRRCCQRIRAVGSADQRANQLNQRAETYHPSSSPAALTTYGSEKLPLADARALLSLIEPDSAGRVTCGGFGKPRRRL
uniref:Uncharacterized protein n=2 Tax=Emiliania huxleyi TaxID=2903 RepID=A0A7S3RRQ9_EMIHU